MKAAFIKNYGSNDVVQIGNLPKPVLRPNDLLIAVKAASVNPIDFKTRDGMLKLIRRYEFPLILGSDLSGVVVEVGSAVAKFKVGDEIFARVEKDRIGTFAEFAAISEDVAALKPENLSHVEAAAIPLVGLTSWQALLEIGKLQTGSKVLIHAGSGGVGTIAIQLAKHFGATVATTVSERNIGLMKSLGADVILDYKKTKFEDQLRDYDIVFDTLAGETQLRSFQILKRNGVLVTIAGVPTADYARAEGLNFFLQLALGWKNRQATKAAKKAGVHFEYLFMRPDGKQLAELGELLTNGSIKPVIDRIFSLNQSKEALAYSETGRAVGKVIIEVAK